MRILTRRARFPIAAVVAATLIGACGQATDGAGGGGDGIDHPAGSDQLVLRVEVVGGFVPVEFNLRSIPGLSLYGDGRLIVQGPVIEIYPGPALPNLQVTRISEEGVQAILEAARQAGLMDVDASYDYPCIADAGTTRFTVSAEGRTSVVQAYALGLEGGDCGGVDVEARAALVELQTRLGDLRGWLPEGSMGREEEFAPSEMRVFVGPYRGEAELAQEPVAWPLTPDLERFGEPIEQIEGVRCGVVSGEGLSRLLPDARRANELTPWTSAGSRFALIFRPLLPDEHGC